MNQKPYQVEAFWDREAQVWVAESEDILELVTEADTIGALTAKLRRMIPELLQLNHLITLEPQAAITFELISHRQESRLSWVWWAKCILRYSPAGERVERTTKTQRTQRLIDPL